MKEKLFSSLNSRRLRLGGYSMAASILVIAIAVAVNLFFSALPSRLTRLDNTEAEIFTLSRQTEQTVSALEQDIQIYWIVQSGQEDSNLGTLLERYASASDHICLTRKDPDVYPGFAKNYTEGQIYNNSLVVESSQRYRYISYSQFYEYDDSDYYSTGNYSVSFAGEGILTSAIDYVTRADMPLVYTLTGHGEASFSTSYRNAVEKSNLELRELSLLSLEAVPADADLLLVNTPQSDLSQEEVDKISTYLQDGGNLLLVTDPPLEDSLENLEALMAGYGVEAVPGMVVENDAEHYVWGTPYYLLPELESHTITRPLAEEGYYVLLSIAQGLNISDTLPEGVSVTALLSTSSDAYAKVDGYSISTYEKEEGDLDGPFALGVAVEDARGEADSRIVWISSGGLLDDQSNASVSGANQDLFLNALSWMTAWEEGITIHAKQLANEYLTIPDADASVLLTVMLAVLPLGCLGLGFWIWMRRKRR